MFQGLASQKWLFGKPPVADIPYLHQLSDMAERLFTIVCEFRGTTYISQVRASDECEAVQVWTELLTKERPFKRASSYLAKSVAAERTEYLPIALKGLTGVWCISGSCGGDFMLADFIETVPPTNGS